MACSKSVTLEFTFLCNFNPHPLWLFPVEGSELFELVESDADVKLVTSIQCLEGMSHISMR